METNYKKKIYMVISVFVSIALILIFVLIIPLVAEIKKNSFDLVSAKNNLVALGAQVKEITSFKDGYASYRPNFEKVDGVFIDPANPVDFIEFLEQTAYDTGVTAKISLAPSSSGPQQAVSFTISSKGSFASVLEFVKKLETASYLVEIGSLNIRDLVENQGTNKKTSSTGLSSGNVEASIALKVFVKK